MKVDFRILQGLTPSGQKKGAMKEAGDFAAVLKETLAKGRVGAVAPEGEETVPFPERPLSLAREILSLLDKMTEASGSKDLLARLEASSVALEQELTRVPQGSGRRLLEEVMLLGAVEAAKWREGYYS